MPATGDALESATPRGRGEARQGSGTAIVTVPQLAVFHNMTSSSCLGGMRAAVRRARASLSSGFQSAPRAGHSLSRSGHPLSGHVLADHVFAGGSFSALPFPCPFSFPACSRSDRLSPKAASQSDAPPASARSCPPGVWLSSILVLAAATALPLAASAQDAAGTALEPVIVTASRIAEPLSSTLADVSVVDRETIERSGAGDVADLLGRLPGVEFSRSGGPGTATGVYIRGGENRHTALYIDGVPVDVQSVGGAAWEQIPLDQIERIEVVRGPGAAVYGSNAVAGVVQIFTRRGEGAARPEAAVTLGSHATRQLRAGISGAANGFDYALSATHGRSSGFDSQTKAAIGHNPDRDGWRRNAVSARLGYQWTNVHRVDASFLNSRLRAGYDGFVPGLDDETRQALRVASIGWRADWSDAANTSFRFGESRSNMETQPDFYRTETTLRNYTLQHEQHVGAQTWSALLERREDRLHNPATLYSAVLDGKRHQDAIGLGWRGNFGAHALQANLRHDRDSEFSGKTTGSAGWGWSFLPQWRVHASASNSFRAPTLYQRFSQYGNADLVPETGRNAELGLRWADATTEVSLTGWRNKLTHLIGFGASGPCSDPFGCYVNVDRARLKGATLAARTQLGAVTLHASLDWHDPRDLDSGKILQRRARRMASFGAETTQAGWTLGGEIQASGRRFEDAGNTQRLAGYALVNLYASRELTRGLTLEARIFNLGDRHYELAQNYATEGRYGEVSLRWAMR